MAGRDDVDQTLSDRIKSDISTNDVVLFMKGTRAFPQCGFSAAVVNILNHLGVPFKDIDVLVDSALRQGIKEYANWPTIPQLYIKGEFVGGCDIVREMASSGEMQQLISEKGIAVASSA